MVEEFLIFMKLEFLELFSDLVFQVFFLHVTRVLF
jgi:hypothetical protein